MSATSSLRENFLRLAQELPSTPAVLGKLQRLLADPNTGLDPVCGLLKRDMALSARIIRISNSAYFGPAASHTSLEEAVGCIGYEEIYKAVGVTIAREFLNRDLRWYGCTAERLWENAVCSALAMESLAQFVGINPRSAYTSGLMRSMGKILLDRLASEQAPPPAPYSAEDGRPLGRWEARTFGWENPAVTALLLKDWNFPDEVGEVVRRHYQPEVQPFGEMPACLLNFAGRIARDLGFGLAGEDAYWEPHPVKFTCTGLTENEISLCTEETRLAFAAVQAVCCDAPAAVAGHA